MGSASIASDDMSRLGGYLLRLFARDALALLVVTSVLLFLIQCLRIFDVVSVKGQGFLTLIGQGVLSMPPLVVVFLYVCMGIGLGRSLSALQASYELHIIHANARVRALTAAVLAYALGGALLVTLLANVVEPRAARDLNFWSAQIAADIVGRTLVPHRFNQVMPGVVIVIGGRQGTGEIFDFFADDRRDPESRRTYFARTATVASTDDGYVLQMRDGAIQYHTEDKAFSQVSFGTYEIDIGRFTATEAGTSYAERDSFDLLAEGFSTGLWPEPLLKLLVDRASETIRVIGMSLLVAALAAFPSGARNRRKIPLEVIVLLVAFSERSLSAYAPLPSYLQTLAGVTVILLLALAILIYRLRLFAPVPYRVSA